MLSVFNLIIVGLGADHKDAMVDALPTLKERLQKGDPNVLYSVVNDLSKVGFTPEDFSYNYFDITSSKPGSL